MEPFSWHRFYARICADTGWTWDQVGRLTLPRVRALYDQFQQQPPVHWLVAAYLQYRPAPARDEGGMDALDLMRLTGGRPVTADMLSLLG